MGVHLTFELALETDKTFVYIMFVDRGPSMVIYKQFTYLFIRVHKTNEQKKGQESLLLQGVGWRSILTNTVVDDPFHSI